MGREPRLGAGLAADHFEDLLDPFRGKRVAVDREKETVFRARLRADVVKIVVDVYVVSESGTKWAFEVTDTLEATTLLPGGSIIVLSFC